MQQLARTDPPKQRRGHWLPADFRVLEDWVGDFAARIEKRGPKSCHPVIQEFADLIADDPVARLYVTSMIAEVPKTKPYRKHHLKSVRQMLDLIDAVLTEAPGFDTTALVGAPLNAILDWSMGTPSGFAAFRHPPLNQMIRKILEAWCVFLDSPESLYVLNDSPQGWKCPEAQRRMGIDECEYDPSDKYWGFRSWNDFFTRRFKPGARPVASPGDDSVITNACESAPYAIARGVKRHDQFWIKGQPYSLQDLLANDPATGDFVGGTVYQAFLSAFNYHRWHSPVSGTILKAFVQPGTYYSEADSEGEDPAGPNNSQGYIAHVATRAIIHIQADNPAVGHMVVMPIGMAEISSCVIRPEIVPGARVQKGQELGCFQYGGSTHCLIFRPGAIAAFAAGAIPQPNDADPPVMPLNSYLATAAA